MPPDDARDDATGHDATGHDATGHGLPEHGRTQHDTSGADPEPRHGRRARRLRRARGPLLAIGAATVVSALALMTLGSLVPQATAEEIDVPPDVAVYERYGGSEGFYWSLDPASTPGGPFGDAYTPIRLWSTPPGDGFTMLYRVDRANGKFFLTTDPAGEGAGPTTPLGYVGTTPEAVEAVLDGCRYVTGLHRYYLEFRYELPSANTPLDHHVVGEQGRVSHYLTSASFVSDGVVGYVESVYHRSGPCPEPVHPPSVTPEMPPPTVWDDWPWDTGDGTAGDGTLGGRTLDDQTATSREETS